ncbi:unnamed protein product [Gordionus sp. m RMFG-2023]
MNDSSEDIMLSFNDILYGEKQHRNDDDDECLKQLKSNYTMLNGIFLAKNVSLKDLPQDFEYIINPENMCYEYVTDMNSQQYAKKYTKVPKDIFIIIMIHTAPSHRNLRESTRETWGSIKEYYNYNIRIIFVLGITRDKSIQQQITNESDTYGDIVQASFLDAYVNMTYKMSMGFKWISYYCPHAEFILKMDDDIYADIFQVITTVHYFEKTYRSFLIDNIDRIRPKEKLLPYVYNQTDTLPMEHFDYIISGSQLREKLMRQATTPKPNINETIIPNDNIGGNTSCDEKAYTMLETDPHISAEYTKLFGSRNRIRDIIICSIMVNSAVLRDPNSKWYVPLEDHAGNFYEPYCSGWIMIMTPSTAYKLHKAYFTQPYLFVDDAHVTGKLARMAGTVLVTIHETVFLEGNFDRFIKPEQFNFVTPQPPETATSVKYVFCNNDGDREKMKFYWNKTLLAHNRYRQFLSKK